MEGKTFGQRLRQFMDENPTGHVCNAGCLRRKIGYHHTTEVNAWLRDARTPKLTSKRIPAIISHLRLSGEQAGQLREAQARSLAQPHPPRKRDGQPKPIDAPTPPPFAGTLGKALAEDLLALLDAAPKGTGRAEEANTITITWRSGALMQQTEAQRERWRAALQSILRRGWQVRYLCQLDKNIYRTVGLVQHMLDYIGLGVYIPRYFTTGYTTEAPVNDLLLIPGFAAAWLYSAHSEQRVDAGIIVREPKQLRAIAAHARQLERQTAPLIYVPPTHGDNAESVAAIRDAEAHAGGRRLFKNGLSAFTHPLRWFEETEEPSEVEMRMPPGAWRKIRDNQRRRIEAFREYVKRYDYFDICPLSALTALVEEGAYPRDDILLPRIQPLPRCLEHLTNVRDLLKRYPHYHIGFVGDDQPAPGGGTLRHRPDSMWQVTGNNNVFLGTWVPEANGQLISVNLHIVEQTIAQGFREYFDQIWSKIPPGARERQAVLNRLDLEIAKLEARIQATDE